MIHYYYYFFCQPGRPSGIQIKLRDLSRTHRPHTVSITCFLFSVLLYYFVFVVCRCYFGIWAELRYARCFYFRKIPISDNGSSFGSNLGQVIVLEIKQHIIDMLFGIITREIHAKHRRVLSAPLIHSTIATKVIRCEHIWILKSCGCNLII